MPQLIPSPWLFILLMSWMTLLLIFKTKVTFATPLNNLTPLGPATHHPAPWSWPWT